jgi:hypothetical protein
MADWSFLTNHARVLLCIAHDPGVRLRDIAARVGITERSAYGIVTDLAEAASSGWQATIRRARRGNCGRSLRIGRRIGMRRAVARVRRGLISDLVAARAAHAPAFDVG